MTGYRQPVLDGNMAFGGLDPRTVLEGMPSIRARGFTPPPLDQQAVTPHVAMARVNHNRWIADCPDCGGAVDVWRDGPHLMICPNCLNATVGYAWRVVAMPVDAGAIEDALMERPIPQTRNWADGETAAGLRAEQAREEEGR